METTGSSLPAGRELRLLTAADMLRMTELGLLAEDERVELLDGAMIVAEPQSPLHAVRLLRIGQILTGAYEPAHHVRYQVPLDCGVHNLPEPDLCVCGGRIEDFREHHPTGADALLVVEIAVTSLELDRSKAGVYASARVPVYWIVDTNAGRIEVRSAPGAGGCYARESALSRGEEIELPGTGRWIRVDALLT